MKAMTMTIRPVLLGLVAAVAVSRAASADPCVTGPYSGYHVNLNDGFSCTVGDKTFSSFSFGSTAGGSGVVVTPGGISVSPEVTSHGPGLLFSSGAISVSEGTPNPTLTFVDVTLDFTVTAGGGSLIKDAALDVAGGTTGSGLASVDETVTTLPPPGAQLHGGFPAPLPPSAVVEFGPVPVVDVVKDILVEIPVDTIGTANITAITQVFSQTTVPEPTTLSILGAALVALGVVRRRKSWVRARG